MDDEFLTAAEAATLTKYPEPYIKALAQAGHIAGVFKHGEWRFIRGQLIAQFTAMAEAEQLKRQTQHRAYEKDKKENPVPRKQGRPKKTDTALIMGKYNDGHGLN